MAKSSAPMSRALQRREDVAGYLFMLPSLIFFVGFVIIPMFICIFTSLTASNMNDTAMFGQFVGLRNFAALFEDKISDTYIDTIELAAPLCDIGNIGIPMEILQKKTGLTEEESAMVRTHTDIGAKLLRDLHVSNDYNDFISTSIDIANYHHENYDGSGYPDALAGDEIPLAAQIVSIVDAYCTLTGRQSMSREEALEAMGREAGIKFNPDIFAICRKILRQLC